MWPCCSAPSRFPAPRISRSRSAIWNPLPSDWCLLIVARRSCASSVSSRVGGKKKYPNARSVERPTRPRS